MKICVLKDVLISKNQIDRYFEGAVPVNLWRALNVKRNIHPFEFVEKPLVFFNGRPRPVLEYLKKEYKKIEVEVGIALNDIL